jgi:hypothetical protein
MIFPCDGSGRWSVRREPDAVTICCSFVPANCPSIAWVIAVGGCTVKLYMNIDEVVAMVLQMHRDPVQLVQLWEDRRKQNQRFLNANIADKAACRNLEHIEANVLLLFREFIELKFRPAPKALACFGTKLNKYIT